MAPAAMAAAMPYITAATAAATVGTAVYSAKKQSDLADKNEALEMAETDEQARRLDIQHKENLKRGRAAAGASGTRPGTGSQQTFISNVGKQQEAEMAWLKKAGASRAGINLEGAKAGAVTTLGKGITTAASQYTSQDWWSPTKKAAA